MLKRLRTAIVCLILISSHVAYATNGDHLIGVGTKSRGMGGVGIGTYHGSESLLDNPSMITRSYQDELLFVGATLFMPNVRTDMGDGYVKSKSDFSVIPGIAFVNKRDKEWNWGIGMFGTAGMGVDYRGSDANLNMMTNLQLMQIALPVAFHSEWLSIGFTPIVQYGALNIRYTGCTTRGKSHDTSIGYHIGLSSQWEHLTLGAVYKSAIDMKYKGQLSTAMEDFTGVPGFSDHLEQPYEIGVGISYDSGGHRIAFDYKVIAWESAEGYGAFGWKDQNVYALGYQYARETWSVRTGIKHAKSPIRDLGNSEGLRNTLNLLGFPAIIKNHYTFGLSKRLSTSTSVDVAFCYAPNVIASYQGIVPGEKVTTKHSQRSVTIGFVQRF